MSIRSFLFGCRCRFGSVWLFKKFFFFFLVAAGCDNNFTTSISVFINQFTTSSGFHLNFHHGNGWMNRVNNNNNNISTKENFKILLMMMHNWIIFGQQLFLDVVVVRENIPNKNKHFTTQRSAEKRNEIWIFFLLFCFVFFLVMCVLYIILGFSFGTLLIDWLILKECLSFDMISGWKE